MTKIPTRDEFAELLSGMTDLSDYDDAIAAYDSLIAERDDLQERYDKWDQDLTDACDDIDAQAERIADDELRIAGLQSAIREKNARIAELEAQCDTMGNALLERGCDGVVHECAVLEARIKELEENDHV